MSAKLFGSKCGKIGRSYIKNRLAAEFLNSFMGYYTQMSEMEYIKKYREKSFVIGKEIDVLFSNGRKKALALDVNEDCHLIVRYEDGTTEELSSGEISINCRFV